MKQQMTDDASKIWQNYTLSKAALAQFDRIDDKHNISSALQPKLTDSMKVDYVLNSTFYDDVDIQEVLKDLNEIKLLKSPRFNKNEAFPKTNSFFTFKTPKNGLKPQKNEVKSINERKENQFEKQTKVDNRMKTSEKLREKPSIITEKPIEPIVEKPVIATSVAIVTELKAQNNQPKLSVDTDSQNKIPKINGSAVTINQETISKPKESIEIEKLPNTEKITQNEEIKVKQSEIKISKSEIEVNTGALTNGHSIDKEVEDAISNIKQQVAKEIEKENTLPVLSKPNEIITATTSTDEPKLDQIEKVPTTVKENGSIKMTSVTSMTNGFAKKLTTFTPIVSDSDSVEISEQISIGQQRLIKSPDDFWI